MIAKDRDSDSTPISAGDPLAGSDTDARDRELFRRLFEQSPIGVAVVGPEGRPQTVNRSLCEMLGYDADELRSRTFDEFTHPEDVDADLEQYRRLMTGEIRDYALDKRYLTAGGDVVWGRLAVTAIREPDGSVGRAVAFVQDVTEERRTRRELRESEQRYRSLFEASRDAIYVSAADGEIVDMNPAGLELFGYGREEMLGMDARRLYVDPDDRERFREAVAEGDGAVEDFEVRLQRRDGEVLYCLLSSTARRDDDGQIVGYQGIIRDVTEQKRLEAELEHRALHDWLTDLPNRALLRDRMEKALARAERRGHGVALLFIDLDGFKRVNDRWSHAAGDELLLQVARRLSGKFRDEDTVARMGGDEFVVLLEGLEDREPVQRAAERTASAFASPFTVEGEELAMDASVGIVTWGLEEREPIDRDELLHAADQAMYRAKEIDGTAFRAAGRDRGEIAGGADG